MSGQVRLNELASKQDFLQESSGYKALHLATHAQANGEPWIAFANEKLSLSDLYTHRINADMVVLSACNTLSGQVAGGEGVLSLSRGFFYSGANSVLASLWNVNDQATNQIMQAFYKNLKDGQTKVEAINNAKRSYLAEHKLSGGSPYYWSSFVLLGNPDPIEFDETNYPLLVGSMALYLVFLILIRKKLAISGNKPS